MSGSRTPDGVVLGPDGELYGAVLGLVIGGRSALLQGHDGRRRSRRSTSSASTDGVGPTTGLCSAATTSSTARPSSATAESLWAAARCSAFARRDGLHEVAPVRTVDESQRQFQPDQHPGQCPDGALIEGSDGFLYGVARVRRTERHRHRLQDRQGRVGLRDAARLRCDHLPRVRDDRQRGRCVSAGACSQSTAISTAQRIAAVQTVTARYSGCASTARSSPSCTCSRRRRPERRDRLRSTRTAPPAGRPYRRRRRPALRCGEHRWCKR